MHTAGFGVVSTSFLWYPTSISYPNVLREMPLVPEAGAVIRASSKKVCLQGGLRLTTARFMDLHRNVVGVQAAAGIPPSFNVSYAFSGDNDRSPLYHTGSAVYGQAFPHSKIFWFLVGRSTCPTDRTIGMPTLC